MDLGQFKILLEKINSLHASMSLDGNISKIEQDLMKSYVSKLYEACVSDEESAKTVVSPPKLEKKVEETRIPEQKEQVYTPPVVQAPVEQSPVVQTPVEPPVVQETPQVHAEPVKKYEPVVQASSETPVGQGAENKGPKTLNERLAESQNKTVTTNDKFKVEEKPKAAYKPPIIINVDHLKGSGSNQVTPPPPPAPKVEVTPIAKPTPTYTAPTPAQEVPARMNASSIADYFTLHNQKKISEISDRLSSAPLADLTKGIGLNDKISMIRELWADDQFAFNNSLNHLNSLNSFDEAKQFIMQNCVEVYGWDEPKKLSRAKQFIDLVRRRYPA